MDVYIAYYVAAAHTLLCKRLEPKGDMYRGTFQASRGCGCKYVGLLAGLSSSLGRCPKR